MLTKGMIMVIIGITGLIITLGIGIYTSRKSKQQLESAESAPSNLSLSEQLTRRKETKTLAQWKKQDQPIDSIPLQPLPELNLGNEIDASKVPPEQDMSQGDDHPSIDLVQPARESEKTSETTLMNTDKEERTVAVKGKQTNHQVQTPQSDKIPETSIMNEVAETAIMQQPKEAGKEAGETVVLQQSKKDVNHGLTPLLAQDETTLINKNDADKTLVMSQSKEK